MSDIHENLEINDDLYNLNVSSIGDNLLYYSYHTRHLVSLIQKNTDRELPSFISAYNGFKGELFENVVYEILIQYAIKNDSITEFVLKGPHQNRTEEEKSKFGLLMDKNQQIVYKAGYKDVSEYDAMFFTTDSIYFVESTIVQSTMGLRKRLRKKVALLSFLFPQLKVKALIILSEGATGIHRFPSYCKVWVTKQLDARDILDKLTIRENYKKDPFINYSNKKLVETHKIKIEQFKYFDSLGWILRKTLFKENKKINEKFLFSKIVTQYFDIYSKIYIGYITLETLNLIKSGFDFKIDKNVIYVTIDKKDDDTFDVVYYVRVSKAKLKKIEIINGEFKFSDKDPKGFTVAEVKFISHNINGFNELNIDDVKSITKRVKSWK